MDPLLGFTPDLPRTQPHIITDCTNLIPYESGMEAGPGETSQGFTNLGATAVGALTITNLSGTVRTYVGTATKLYEYVGTVLTDRSAGGGSYASTAAWKFTQFGDFTIAGSYNNQLQVASGAAFAAIAGAPNAKIVFSVVTSGGGFVLALNTNTSQDQWACSGLNDHTTWTPSIATQANTGRLLGNDAGALTAGIEFGDAALAFKVRTMFVGRYVGPPATFEFSEVPGGSGCSGINACCVVDGGVFFVGPDQIWLFDGSRSIPVADNQVRTFFFTDLADAYREQIQVTFDRPHNRVYIWYPDRTSSGLCNSGLVYHLTTKQWGRVTHTVAASMIYIQPGISWDSAVGTWTAQTNTWDSNYWKPSARSPSIFNGSNDFVTLTGPPGPSSFTTEDIGLDDQETRLNEMRLRYQIAPATAQATGYTLDEAGDTASTVATIASSDSPFVTMNKFDLRQRAKFHRVKFDFTGTTRVIGKQPTILPAGGR